MAGEVERGAVYTRGRLAEDISRSVVQLFKDHGGKGPSKCRTYIEEDLVVILMRGGYSRLEHTLFEDGKWLDVRSQRHAFQDTMEGRLTEVVERLVGRQVDAFMSASHQDPDLQLELFLLERSTVSPAVAPPEPG